MASSAAAKGAGSRLATSNIRATTAGKKLATHATDIRLRFHASADASATNAASTAAEVVLGKTLNRSVTSQSIGEKINAAVAA